LSGDEWRRRYRRGLRLLFRGVRSPFWRFAHRLTRLALRRFAFPVTAPSIGRRRLSRSCVTNASSLPLSALLLAVSGALGASPVDRDGLGAPDTILNRAGWKEPLERVPGNEKMYDATQKSLGHATKDAIRC
jgi:hypothetical protein